ncbi:GNAT family N-acetyltransferase [Arthrobacter tecti]
MNFTLAPVDPSRDAVLLHSWVTDPHARFWDMQEASLADVMREYTAIHESQTHHAYLGYNDDDGEGARTAGFLTERYLPGHDPVGATYPVQSGDVGMHLLVPRTEVPVPGFTTAVITFILEHLFSDPDVQRVVVEPDVRNTKVHALNARVGFEPSSTIELPGKRALLSFCTRSQFLSTFQEVSP